MGKMKLENLQELYLDELKDVYDAEHQIVEALPKMEKAASDPELKEAFRNHLKETKQQVARLEQIFDEMGEKPSRKSCKGMKGLLAEGEEYVKARGDADTIDASLISAAQRVEHYEIAVYGTLRAYAECLDQEEHVSLLQATLDEEGQADKTLTMLAENVINLEAARR